MVSRVPLSDSWLATCSIELPSGCRSASTIGANGIVESGLLLL